MDNMNTVTATTLRNGQIVTIRGLAFAIEKIERDGVFVMLASDYAKTRAAQLADGHTGGYYTKPMLRAMLKDGTLVLSVAT